jgi:hypothetical protein
MKVGEMIFALVFPVWVAACAWWSWRYQHRVLAVAHRSSPPARGAARPGLGRPLPAKPSLKSAVAPAPVAVGQLDRSPSLPCTSVLGWDEFTLQSVFALDGTALLSCRREGDASDLTIVLLIGDDPRADHALALLHTWQIRQTTLRVRPTSVAGAIEVFAGRAGAVRAGLLAA